MLRSDDLGSVFPDDAVIMAKITDMDVFSKAAGEQFADEKEALKWLKEKKIYISEEV